MSENGLRIDSLEALCKEQALEIKKLKHEMKRLIKYSNYLATNLDKSISYSEYLATHVDNVYSHYHEIRPCKNFKDLFYD